MHEVQVDAWDDNLTYIDPATRSSAGRARGVSDLSLNNGIMKAKAKSMNGSNLK